MHSRARFLGLIFVTLILAITACGGPATPSTSGTTAAPVQDRVLKVAMTFLDEPPDPYQAGWLAVPTGLAETLFRLGDDLKPEPWLATGATRVDPTTWEIGLRAGVKFHNGAVMDAAKVKGSLDLALLRRPGTRVLLDVDRVEVKDPSTVLIITNAPNPTLPGLLTNQNTSIADPDTVPTSLEDSAERAAMTGPYKLMSFNADQEMTVEAHADYWQGTPAMDRVEYVAFTQSDTRLIALQSGDVDISVNLSPQGAVVVGNDSSLNVRTAPPSGMLFMFVNHESPAMQDPLVRRAIAIAVDRNAMAEGVADGNAVPAESLFPPGFISCQNNAGYSYDPEAARQLLVEAGYQDENGDGIVEKDGKALELVLQTYPEQPLLPPMLEAFQSMLRDIGVGAKVQIVEWTLASQGGYDLFGYSNGTITTGDPQWALTRQYLTGGDENRGNFSNSRVDELIGQLSAASEPAQRQQVACDALQAGQEEVALIPVMFPNQLYGISDSVVWTSGPHAVQLYFIDHLIGLK
ncbi:MAG: ABC transporter substrate-binding protein [Chloroflexi bacterium]|nr:ABC transporter substrate-binding protein [Chloroflexota bacterium]